MKPKITLLESEIFSALGDYQNRSRKLKNNGVNYSSKSTELTQKESIQSYPYYIIDESERPVASEHIISYLKSVIQRLLDKSNLNKSEIENCALFLGTSSIDLSVAKVLENEITNDENYNTTIDFKRLGAGYYLQQIKDYFGFKSLSLTYNTACTSSANALLDASHLLQDKTIDYAIVIGLEIYLPAVLEGFISLGLLSTTSFKPFDKEHSGFILGESVCAILLSQEQIRTSDYTLLGGQSHCDTYSITGANPDGVNMALLMQQAMQKANIKANQVNAIKAHGTASQSNDEAELNAMQLAFATNKLNPSRIPPFFSLKPYIGHTLGACALAELIILIECLDNGFIPKSPNYHSSAEGFSMAPLQNNLTISKGVFMLNYFGFGGNNTSMLIQKA